MSRIAIYQDYVHNVGGLVMALQERGLPFIFVDAHDIAHDTLKNNIGIFIMPGGADLYYCEKLNGKGNAAIRDFVEQGGGYLGICAGAYYGCTSLNWNDGEISGVRELGFIDATATGPLCDVNGSWYETMVLSWGSKVFSTLYAAGPVFKNLDADVEVIASYPQGPAVIAKNIGKGRVVLSSPHIEVTGDRFAHGRYKHNTAYAPHEKAVAVNLVPDMAQQREFFTFILKTLI